MSRQGQGYWATPGIYSDAQEAGWKAVAGAVHARQGRIALQLWHVGRLSHRLLQEDHAMPVAPSAIQAQNARVFVMKDDGTAGEVQPDPPRALEPVRHSQGRNGVRAAMASLARVARTEHAIVGEVYAPGTDADYALGRITCVAHHWSERDGEVTDLVWHLRYDDEYARTDTRWRIARRALTINAIEARPVRRLRV